MDILTGPPPPGGDQDRGRIVYSFYWTIFSVGLVFTSLRFWVRIQLRALGWDDWIMAFTMLQLLALTIAGTILLLNGGCRHVYYLIMDQGPDQLVKIGRLFYICQPFAIMGLATGRVAVAALVLRLMGPSWWRKSFLWFTMISTFLISMLNSILLFAPCKPADGVWNPFTTAHCWNPVIMTDVTIASSSWNVFIDVCLALIPVTIFWNLNMTLKKRAALCVLMSGGLLAAICGIVKTTKLPAADDPDVTWATYDLLLWNGAETFLVVVCGSIPALKPIYDICLGRRRVSLRGAPYQSEPSERSRNKVSYPSRSTGDDSYIRLEPLSNAAPTIPKAIKVEHRVDIEAALEREEDSHTRSGRSRQAPWENTS